MTISHHGQEERHQHRQISTARTIMSSIKLNPWFRMVEWEIFISFMG